MAEQVFTGHARPEYNWRFRYVIVRNSNGTPVAATFFTVMLNKDDMLMRDSVSQAVERFRESDPYFLTSEIVSMGSGFSEGNHLYLDRTGPWRQALVAVLEVMTTVYEEREAGMLLLRDLPGEDPEMDAFLLERGLVKVPMFDSHYLDVTWEDEVGFLARVSRRKRKHLREIIALSEGYEARFYGVADHSVGRLDGRALPREVTHHLHRLYRNVASRKLRLNVFPLPLDLFPALLHNPAWEIASFHLDPACGGPEDGRAVAMYAAHHHGGHYAPFLCGLDYDYVYSHGAYRTMLINMTRRIHDLGVRCMHLGMDADMEKSRLGTRVVKNAVYVQARDHYNASVLREIVANVGLNSERPGVSG